jgi:hypothetical protein
MRPAQHLEEAVRIAAILDEVTPEQADVGSDAIAAKAQIGQLHAAIALAGFTYEYAPGRLA